MRIRSTKPEFWRSRRIAAVDWEARFVLKGLESYVDDNGVGKDDLELIVGDLFSRDLAREPSRTLKRVQVALSALHQASLLHRYEADGTDLLYISWWESIQRINRPSAGRFRRPDGTLEFGESEIGAPNVSPQEPSRALSAGTGEQGNRGTGENTCASADAERVSDPDVDFDAWYAAYPRKRGKGQAVKAYRAARKKASAQVLLDAIRAQHDTLTARGPEYVPYPATWLNGERWADDLDDATPATPEARPAQRLPLAPRELVDDPRGYDAWVAAWNAGQPVRDANGNLVRREAS